MDTKKAVNFFNSDLDLESYLSETVVKAGRNDEAYKAAQQRVSECKNRIPKLTQVLDLEKPAELSLSECKVLIEYLLANNLISEPDKELYHLVDSAEEAVNYIVKCHQFGIQNTVIYEN